MRRLALLLLIVLPGFAVAEKPDGPALSVADAAKKVNEKVTVEMVVGSTGSSGTKKFLNSEKNFRDDKNFTIMIDMSKAGDKFKELKIEDPLKHFGEKTIRVTGTVTEFKGHAEIVVTDPDQIKIVEKK